MDYQLFYLIFGLVLLGATQAAWIDRDNQGGAVSSQRKRQIENSCFYNMCNDTDDYPEDEIRQLVEKTPGYKELFGTVLKPRYQVSVESRHGADENVEKNMCGTTTHYTTPKRALDIHGAWQIVVNGQGMEQLIEYQSCDEDASCDAQGKIPGRTVSCRIQEIIIRLFVYTKKSNGESELQLKSFALPAGCYCAAKYDNFRDARQRIFD